MNRDGSRDHLAVVSGSFFIGIGHMLLLVGTYCGGSIFRGHMLRTLEGDHLIGAVLVFAVLAGLTSLRRVFYSLLSSPGPFACQVLFFGLGGASRL